jgi:hypothetical protein
MQIQTGVLAVFPAASGLWWWNCGELLIVLL